MRRILIFFAIFSLVASVSVADFNWVDDFNIKAKADLNDFKAKVSAEFNVGSATVKTVLDDVEKPSDAYILFELGEISGKSVDAVLNRYKAQREKGWGALAKSLGIKPGSAEFHALKNGKTFYQSNSSNRSKKKSKSRKKGKKGKKSKGKGKGR